MNSLKLWGFLAFLLIHGSSINSEFLCYKCFSFFTGYHLDIDILCRY